MPDFISTVIVDDEQRSVFALRKLLEKYCPGVKIVGEAHNVNDAIILVDETTPDLLFLDISMPDGDGFEVIERAVNKNFEVIFTTAHDYYAVKAFEMSALHYLLKPIDDKDLQNAVERYERTREQCPIDEKIDVLKDNLGNRQERIILPTLEGFSVINVEEIIRCEADNNYTLFYLINERQILVSKTLNTFERMMSDMNFCRVHSKHLVNLDFVKQYVRGRGGYLMLNDGSYINVSETKKSEFLNKMRIFARTI